MTATSLAAPDSPLYLCGFPKAGLHALELLVTAFMQPEIEFGQSWFGMDSHRGWGAELQNVHTAIPAMKAIRPGYYAKGHTPYIPQLANALVELGVRVAFIYRDLRDVVISQTHHVLSNEERFRHPGKALYQALPDVEAVQLAVIGGVGGYPGLFERWSRYAPWLHDEWICPVRFEDVIYCPKKVALDVLDYVYARELSLPDAATGQIVLQAVANLRKRHLSATYRKGRVGDWKRELTAKAKAAFKARDPGWLIRLGYAKDNDW